jgi:RES domain-containing protein
VIIWRLCRQRHADRPLDGEGARLYGGRWNYPGTAVVYTAGTLALAALEVLVHVDHDIAPTDLVSIPIEVPAGIRIEEISIVALPANWRDTPAPAQLQEMGTDWVHRATSLLLQVPSAVIPEEHNYLVNLTHPEVTRLKVGRPKPFTFDPRLLRNTAHDSFARVPPCSDPSGGC